jgi:hypothetical protein
MKRGIIINCLLLLALSLIAVGCSSTKLPAGDVEVLQRYRTEIEILKDPKIKPNTKLKYDAAKVIFANVDFSYARTYKDVQEIFSFNDVVGKTLYGGKKSLVFKYSWEDKVIEGNFFFIGTTITGCKVNEYSFDPNKPLKVKSFNPIKQSEKAEWKTSGAK